MGVQEHWSLTPAANATADSTINWREGQAPSTVNDSSRAEMAQITKWRKDTSGELVTSGTAAAYVLATNEQITALSDGLSFSARVHVTNNAGASLNVDATGAKPIHLAIGTAITASALLVDAIARFTYYAATGVWLVMLAPTPQTIPPNDAQYLVGAANAVLAGERVVTDTSSITWDLTAAGQARANLSGGVLTNTQLVKTGAYNAANADKGKTLALGGNAYYTVAFGAIGGFDANFAVMVTNTDSVRAKLISLNAPSTTFLLYPYQSVIVSATASAWAVTPGNGAYRWRPITAPTFYVNYTLGTDTGTDGLGQGGGAFQTIQAAVDRIRRDVDASVGIPAIQLADGTHEVGSGLSLNTVTIGSDQFLIHGDYANPELCIIRCSAGGTCVFARDQVIVTIKGVTFATTGNGSTAVSVSQGAVVDLGLSEAGVTACRFGNFPLGTHMYCTAWASINVLGDYAVTGNVATHIACTNGGYVNYGGFICTGSAGLTVDYWVTQQSNSVINAGGSPMTFSGFAGHTGQKYSIANSATLVLSGGVFPGAGTTVATNATVVA